MGPGPVVGADTGSLINATATTTTGINPATGAIESLATPPNNAGVIFVGTVNGGI